MIDYLQQFNIIHLGIMASLIAGLATGVGAVPIFFKRKFSKKYLDCSLGFAAGVMLAATSFSLILPAIEAGGGGIKGATITVLGMLIGGIFLDLLNKFFPDTNLLTNSRLNGNGNSHEPINGKALKKVWLFAIAITLHNFPEGLAVGVGFGDGNIANGLSLAIAIGLQNIPEGLAVALPFLKEKFSPTRAFLIALTTGLVEPIGGLLGVGLVSIAKPLLPLGLAFAAGAMLFVIASEIIPETQKGISSKMATHFLLIGFVIMMFLDNVLG
ncbi:protein gufA [Anoxybacter fermentans]|uniref:Protein gufA n=1 Tax=Anoxybacter fermentans TaxID=1323375 RepID=A0A3Q9HRV6_9FIRM|nr:ZIP family metal transporter [Anoxybacter fermentans]AZR74193.1 protein gufA [Anoxybacter fermentans]